MTKNLIVQVCITKDQKETAANKACMFSYIPDMYKLCARDAEAYAKNVGADYHLITTYEYDLGRHVSFQRYAAFYEQSDNIRYDDYDNIICIDGDYTFVANAPNIFDIMNENEDDIWFAVPDNKFYKDGTLKKLRQAAFKQFDIEDEFYYFNIGLYGMKREARQIFRDKLPEYFEKYKTKSAFADQNTINKVVQDQMNDRYCQLNKNWNGVFSLNAPDFAIHYAGLAKQRFTPEKHNELLSNKKKKIETNPGSIYHEPIWQTDRSESIA